jgi:FkbM family methyltransferase
MTKEIIYFLKKIKKDSFRNIFVLADKKRKAFGLLTLFLKGKLNFKEFILSLKSVQKRPIEITFKRQNAINEYIINYLKKHQAINEDLSLNLFYQKFYYLNIDDVLGSIDQLIIYDEYDIKNFLKEDSVVLDVGANIGVFSVYCANVCKNGRVYSFEPVSFVFGILSKNTKNYKNCFCFKLGVGSENEEKIIKIRSWNPGYSTIDIENIERKAESFDVEEKIKIVKLDDWIKESDISKIDFIKIDVEGYELEVLKGAIETIKKFKPVLGISIHHPKLKDEVFNFFDKNNLNYNLKMSSKDSNDIFAIYK